MAYILENDVLRLECTQKAGEMLHLVKKSTGRETLYQGDQGWSYRVPRRQARQPGVHRRQGLLHRRAADRELRRRPGRGAASQAHLLEGPLPAQGRRRHDDGPRHPAGCHQGQGPHREVSLAR